jgi:hypothetical protein
MNPPFVSAAPACQRTDRASANRLNPYTSASPSV